MFKDPEAITKYQSATNSLPDANPMIGEDFKKRLLEENKKGIACTVSRT